LTILDILAGDIRAPPLPKWVYQPKPINVMELPQLLPSGIDCGCGSGWFCSRFRSRL